VLLLEVGRRGGRGGWERRRGNVEARAGENIREDIPWKMEGGG